MANEVSAVFVGAISTCFAGILQECSMLKYSLAASPLCVCCRPGSYDYYETIPSEESERLIDDQEDYHSDVWKNANPKAAKLLGVAPKASRLLGLPQKQAKMQIQRGLTSEGESDDDETTAR